MIEKEEIKEQIDAGYMKAGEMCPDYTSIEKTSKRCQNCRYNHFVEGNIMKQTCKPHTHQDAIRKGEPGVVPDSHCQEWLDRAAEHAEERRRLAKERGEEVEEQ